MINTSLKLQNEINPKDLSLLTTINKIANELNISYIVVGATARDLVFHHAYGAPIRRATADIDFAIQVNDWSQFSLLKNALIYNKFKTTNSEQRLKSPENIMIDIIPFEAIESNDSKVIWPPNGEIEMNVLGFQAAHDHAIQVILKESPQLKIPVVSPQGITLLKIIAWSQRDEYTRKKDARDLVYIMEAYERVNHVLDRIYDENILIEQYNWDISSSQCPLTWE
jgi:predicted nucleotidyltransferase